MSTSVNHLARSLAYGVSVVAIFTLLPLGVAAQSTVRQEAARADETHLKASDLLATQDRGKWLKAARLLEKAANQRAFEDAAAVHERALAAEIYASLGLLPQAQQHLEDAADQALRNGKLLHAAELFVKAASIADVRGYASTADTHLRHAHRLAASPHLTQSEGDLIHQRVIRARTTNPDGGR